MSRMFVDLHVHTSPRSACSNINPVELVREARRLGLEGLCLTEHNLLWAPEEIAEVARDEGVRIFRGNEVTTDQGDVLVFGYYQQVSGVVRIEDLREEVVRAGGIMIAAHPFRGFLLFGVTDLQMDVERAAARKVFSYVDGVETCNSRLSEQENRLASQVAERLGLAGLAGSDAHNLDELGRCVTVFQRPIEDEAGLIEEIKAGRFETGFLR